MRQVVKIGATVTAALVALSAPALATDSDLATTGTTLFDVNTANDTLVIQSPANAGTLAMTGQLTVDATGNAGFDVYSAVRNGTTVDNRAFATLQAGGSYALYEVSLLTGEATSRGKFRPGLISHVVSPGQTSCG